LTFLRKLFRFRERSTVAPPPKKPEPENEEALVKPFLDHLEDLRVMLVKSVITLMVAMILAFIFRVEIVRLLQTPLSLVDPKLANNLQSFGVTDAMTISFKLAFYAGLVASFPLLLWYLADFVFPGLTKREKRYVTPALFVGAGLFMVGVSFCFFFMLPAALEFFHKDALALNWTPNWTVKDYFSFVTQLCLAFGLSFELPVVILVLVKLELLTYQVMSRTRTYAIVGILAISAIITPTTDLLTLLALAGPLILLYEICIWLAWFIDRRKNTESAPEL